MNGSAISQSTIGPDVRHISFDLWLTLIRSRPGFKERRALLFSEHFGINLPPEVVAARIRHYDRLANTINEKAGGNIDSEELVLLILADLGMNIDTISKEELTAFYEKMEQLLFLFSPVLMEQEIHATLGRLLDRGYSLSILSNTGFIRGKTMEKVLEKLDLKGYFAFRLYSDELGFSKPSAAAFEEVWKALAPERGLEKHQVLHLGDNPVADLQGARQYGFQAGIVKAGELGVCQFFK